MIPKYRRVDRSYTCPCGANLGATFVVELDEPDPIVTFRHLADGSHVPELTGNSAAARSRREGRVLGSTRRVIQ